MSDPTTHPPPDANTDGASYDIFLSYNSRDGAEVRDVRRLLTGRGVKTFYDRADLHLGRMWFDELQEAVARSRAVAVFVGPHGIGTWQKREMALALDRQANAEGRDGARLPVIPVLLPGSQAEEAPGLLLLNTWLDLSRGLDDPGELDKLARAARGRSEAAAPAGSAPEAVAPLPPYRDLRAFREEDAPLFYGREVFARDLLEKTKAHGLVAVVGPSGSGKSSVVQAGLLPLLRRQPPPHSGWDAVTFTPGENPFHYLALPFVSLWERGADRTSLVIKAGELGDAWAKGAPLALAVRQALEASGGTTDRLLVVADQFEELFTLTPEALRRPFLEALLAASKLAEVTVLLTLRADFYGQAVGFSRELSDLMQRGQVNLGPMTREELRRSVEEPARHAGLRFEPGLVGRILDHVEGQPGSLPLLEFALTELWLKRRGAVLSNGAYDEIGGVEGAVGRRADAQLATLAPTEADGLLRFLTRLVRVSAAGEEGADTRQRATLAGLDGRTAAAVESFVRARLLVKSRQQVTDAATGDPAAEETVEVAHESLIRRWPRLRELLDRDRAFLLWRQRLRLRLDDYERTSRDPGTLLAGAPLKEALKFLRERPQDLTDPERDYIHASDRASARPRLRSRIAAAVLAVALLGALGAWAWYRSDAHQLALVHAEAAEQSRKADAEALNRWLAALALSGRVEEALAAARAVGEPDSPALALSAVADALARAGRADDARHAAEEAERAAAEERDLRIRAVALANVARSRLALGQGEEARRTAAGAFEANSKFNDAFPVNNPSASEFVNQWRIIEVLIRTDQIQEARVELDTAGKLDLYRYACRELIRLNKVREARSLVDSIEFDLMKIRFLKTLVRELNAVGAADEARSAAAMAYKKYEHAVDLDPGAARLAAEIFIEVGDMAAAARAARQLHARVEKRGQENVRISSRGEAVVLLAKAGRLDEALEVLRANSKGGLDAHGYASLAGSLARAGRAEEARRVAEEAVSVVTGEDYVLMSADVEAFLEMLVETGRAPLARALLKNALASGWHQPYVARLPRMLLERGAVDESLAFTNDMLAAGWPGGGSEKAYRAIADLYAGAGRDVELRNSLAGSQVSYRARSELLLYLTESLVAAGRVGSAKEALADALAEAGRAGNTEKLPLLARASKAQARLGLLREAQQTVRDCSPDDKLALYSVIVLKYAGLPDARLVALLDPEEAGDKLAEEDEDD